MGYLANLSLNTIMFKSRLDKMVILHHTTKVGGDILNKTEEYFGLFDGGEFSFFPKIQTKIDFKISEVEVPGWDTIKNQNGRRCIEQKKC